MAKGKDNMQPLGICRGFFKFIMNHLSSQGIKRVTLGPGRESVEVPIEEGPSSIRNHVNTNTTVRRLSKPNGEVVIEFRHIEALENALPKQSDAGFPVRDKGPREIKRPPAAAERGLKKNKHDPKDIAIHEPMTSGNNSIQSQDTATLSRLLQRTESNINEKADAFIRSRKEALRQALQP